MGMSNELAVRLVKALAYDCVLDMDALEIFDFSLNFKQRVWQLGNSVPMSFDWVEDERDAEIENLAGICELSDSEMDRLRAMLDKLLPPDDTKLGTTHLITHSIDTQGAPAIKQKRYPVSPKVREAMYKEVDGLLKEGIIEPSTSAWSSPIVMIRKPNGTYRFCLDFRKLNEVTKKDAYPLPNMNEVLSKLRNARFISTLDLSQAYFQVPLEKESKEFTAFTVPGRGLFQFTRLPFGLSNAPATFQRLMDRIITPEMDGQVYCYLDDIVIVSETLEEHMHWFRIVINKLKDTGLTMNREKSVSGCKEVRYLGFLVNKEGLQTDPEKIKAVKIFRAPETIKQLRRFLGMASWYRRFINNFAQIADPLHRLLKKSRKWEWGEEEQKAFDALKTALTTAPILACPNFALPFTLQTDACSTGLGATLTQVQDGHERVIAYASNTLNKAERNYTVTEWGCLAVVWAVRKFREYLEGYHFTVVTDHSSLKWMYRQHNPVGRVARWAMELAQYDFEIVHRKGSLHHVPDSLSRMLEGGRKH